MSPQETSFTAFVTSAPRVSGDEPDWNKDTVIVLECSPRERG